MFKFLKWRLTLNFQIWACLVQWLLFFIETLRYFQLWCYVCEVFEFYIYLQENRLLPNSNTPDVDMAKQITTYGEVQEQLDVQMLSA